MVGVSGFEPEASWTRTKRDTKLRHTPLAKILYGKISFLSRGIRGKATFLPISSLNYQEVSYEL